MMNFIRLLVPLFIFSLWNNQSFSQNKSVTYIASEKPLADILNDIEKEYNVHFSYPSELIKGKIATIEVSDIELELLLSQLLNPHDLGIEKIKQGYYAIKPLSEVGITLEGIITDPFTDSPLPFASLQVKNSLKGTTTDESGYFSLKVSNAGNSILVVKYLGYEPFEINAWDFYKSKQAKITLKPKKIYLKEITIKEYLNYAITTDDDISKISVRPKDMEILPGLTEADILHSIQMIPGVYANDETASGINIRGSSNGNGLIYWDRIPVYHAAHYFGMISSLISATIEKVDVYRNEIPVKYGGTISGLVDIAAWDSVPHKLEAEIGVNMTQANVFFNAPIFSKKSSLMVAARSSYDEVLTTPTLNLYSKKIFDTNKKVLDDISITIKDHHDDDDHLNEYMLGSLNTFLSPSFNKSYDQQLRFWDINLKWILQPGFRNYFSTSCFIGSNELTNTIEDKVVSSLINESHSASTFGGNLFWKFKWNKKWHQETSLSYTDYNLAYHYLNYQSVKNKYEDGKEDNKLRNTEGRTQLTFEPSPGFEICAGYQFNAFDNRGLLEDNSLFYQNLTDSFGIKSVYHSAFANFTNYSLKRWRFNAGLRYGLNNNINTFTPVFSANFKLGKDAWLKSSFGIYHQQLRLLKESALRNSIATENIWVLANNQDIPLLKNKQVTIGFWKTGKGWVFDFDLYLKKLNGLLLFNQTNAQTEDSKFESGTGSIYGLDLMIRKKFTVYSTWVSYTLSRAVSLFPSVTTGAFPSPTDHTHRFRWSHVITIGAFECSAAWTYRTGLPYTKPADIKANINHHELYFYLVWEEPNSRRLPDYHRLDVSLWYKFPKKIAKKIQGTMGLSVLNLYNRRNIWQRNYQIQEINGDRTIEVLEEEKYFLNFTPNLTIRLNL